MNTTLKWHLEAINWNDINAKKYGGDIFCNTTIINFFTLEEAWKFLGFRLKKQRVGYSGIRNNVEYVLTKRQITMQGHQRR